MEVKNGNSSAIQLDLTASQSFSLLTQLKISLYGRTVIKVDTRNSLRYLLVTE